MPLGSASAYVCALGEHLPCLTPYGAVASAQRAGIAWPLATGYGSNRTTERDQTSREVDLALSARSDPRGLAGTSACRVRSDWSRRETHRSNTGSAAAGWRCWHTRTLWQAPCSQTSSCQFDNATPLSVSDMKPRSSQGFGANKKLVLIGRRARSASKSLAL